MGGSEKIIEAGENLLILAPPDLKSNYGSKAFWLFVCLNLLFLVFNLKTDLNQMNDDLNETSTYPECL